MAFLEDYTLLEELGQGAFATVYKVRHNKLGYIRAVRVLNKVAETVDKHISGSRVYNLPAMAKEFERSIFKELNYMEEVKNIVAKNIYELRKKNNMTQLELAEKLNYSDKTVSKWEKGENSPDITVLVEIANIFGVSLDYLVKL